eukprot:GHRR01014347.1.p2 GENE.GHRR01014347.1~~GHRR01014347.1.p2  ORF type:complete len:210 (+),score=54.27 GHRR01014347.1:485-1114(+)
MLVPVVAVCTTISVILRTPAGTLSYLRVHDLAPYCTARRSALLRHVVSLFCIFRVTDEPILVRQKTSSAMGSARQLTTMPASIGAAATAANSPPSFSLGDSGRDKLRTQQRLQDELTDELLDMGQELKATSLSMHNAIRYRGKLLEDAGDALDDSAANAKSIAAKTKQQYDRSSSSLCQTCLILVVVALMFSTMIVWIKLTSMVGIHGI